MRNFGKVTVIVLRGIIFYAAIFLFFNALVISLRSHSALLGWLGISG